MIQPIYLDDLIDCLMDVVGDNSFNGETLEIGGPERITIEGFLRRVHSLYRGRDPYVLHIPLKLLIPLLKSIEKPFYSILPFTAGQLSSFINDGVIKENRLFTKHQSGMKTIKEMLSLLVRDD